MPCLLRIFALVAALLIAGAATAESPGPAPASKGGLFGFFSGNGSSQTKPSPDVSGTPASNSSYWTETKGGSVLGLTGLEAPEQCTGKLCNLYYGDGSPEESELAATPAQPTFDPNVPTTVAEPEAVAPSPHRRGIDMVETRPSCAATAQDPWRCYRR